MVESVEVRFARIEEQFKFMIEDSKEARASRKIQYESIEKLGQAVTSMAAEVTDVKAKLAGQAPTIEEFITIKHKVVGAGKLGKVVWAIGAFIIGMLYANREFILSWLKK